jgi:putative SOS response-associated peptidase YedK
MCGRFVFTDPSRIKSLLPETSIDEQVIIDFRPSYNIAPSQPVLTILNDQARTLTLTRWGLIPSWSKDKTTGYNLINARWETLFEKPMFRALAQKQRCLIFADGFYEWKQAGKRKQPYFIHRIDQQPMAFAGLWDTWKNQGTTVISSTIITTTASRLLAPIHDRMPVIIPREGYAAWLDSSPATVDAMQRSLMVEAPETLEAYAVALLVNNPQNSGPECIQRLASRD